MKKIACCWLLTVCTFLSISAQSAVASFLEKHGKDENIRLISIGKKMLNTIAEQSLGTPELLEAIKGLNNIQIITSEDAVLSNEYYDSAYAILSKDKDFTEIYSTEDEDFQLIVKKKTTKGIVNELVILYDDSKGFNLINLSGNINLTALLNYSVQIGFRDWEKWEKLEN